MIRRTVTDQFAGIESAFESAFRRAQQEGELATNANPRSLARFLLATLNGLRVIGTATPDRAVLSDIADTTLARLPFHQADRYLERSRR